MEFGDALPLAMAAFADLALLAHLRRRHGKRERARRIMRALRLAVKREISADLDYPRMILRRAS